MGYTIPDNDLAAFPIQSQIFETDLSILAAAYAGYRVVSGCAVTAQGSPDMTVAVAAGVIRPGDATLVSVSASAALAVDAADATLWRLDLVSVAANGTVTHTAGTAAALTAVKPPALPTGHVALAFVTVPPAATIIATDQIIDKRPFMASPEPIAPVVHGNLGATHTFDYADGSAHEGTADAACTVTLAGPAGVQEQILEVGITEDGTGGHVNSFTWDPSIVWEGGTAPILDDTAGAYNLLVFRSIDGGTTWYGFTKFGAVGATGPAGTNGTSGDADALTTAETDTSKRLAPDGAGGVAWASAGAGGLVLLEQHTASGSASLDFTAFVSSAYDEYVVEGVDIAPADSGPDLVMEVGTGAGPTWDTGNNYNWGAYGISPTGGGATSWNGLTGLPIILHAIANHAAYGSGSFSLRATALQSTAHRKRFHGTACYAYTAPAETVNIVGIIWTNAATAATGLRFLMSSGNIASGTIRIYGITK